jgi:hypothetical protein
MSTNFTQSTPPNATNAILIENRTGFQLTADTSATSQQTATLEGGMYDVISDAAAFIKVAPTATTIVTSGAGINYPIVANTPVTVAVSNGNKIGAKTTTGTATVSIHRVG